MPEKMCRKCGLNPAHREGLCKPCINARAMTHTQDFVISVVTRQWSDLRNDLRLTMTMRPERYEDSCVSGATEAWVVLRTTQRCLGQRLIISRRISEEMKMSVVASIKAAYEEVKAKLESDVAPVEAEVKAQVKKFIAEFVTSVQAKEKAASAEAEAAAETDAAALAAELAADAEKTA